MNCIFLAAAAAIAAEPVNVPELMKMESGETVASVEQWEKVRRPEIRRFFETDVYGRRPVERPPHLAFSTLEPDRTMMDGKAVRKRVRVEYGGAFGTNSFAFTAFLPKDAPRPAPSFVLICNRDPKENIDPERVNKSGFWPAEEIIRRGYAAIAFYNGEVTPDTDHGRRLGAFAAFEDVDRMYRDREGWGVLSCWGWGASRVLDWIETEPTLDAKHVAVIGHSRGGKTALVAAAFDERFALACSNDSGCGGAKLHHIDLPQSEHIVNLSVARGFWFCSNFAKWTNRDFELPYDQHEFVALIAPRAVAFASATKDDWAGPLGEYWTARLASPAWELYGKKGLVSDGFPAPGTPLQDGTISYHLREGEHNLTPYDWDVYMDFADRLGFRK
ncbi:MAG: acetylxylan esterase [Kiritimatiellae bacterium]|nr:acetylxylan esterase [Kiritimatiellia bacterium]